MSAERPWWREPGMAVGAAIVVVVAMAALLAPWLAPYGFEEQHPDAILAPPGGDWLLGTDRLGRDLLSRVLYGARVSVSVALATSAVAMLLGTAWGAVSGWVGGRVDALMMRIVDAIFSLPDLLLIIFVATLIGQSLWGIVLALSLVSWVTVARLVRGEVRAIKQRPFVEAARALGSPPSRIVWREILPNVLSPILITLTFRVPAVILAESTLSFLGLGLQAPLSSWGVLAADGWTAMAFYPHLIIWPSVAIFVTILGFNLLGEGLRRRLGGSV